MIEIVDDEENMEEETLGVTNDVVQWAHKAIMDMFAANSGSVRMFVEISNATTDRKSFYVGVIREGYGSIWDQPTMNNVNRGICIKTDLRIYTSEVAAFWIGKIKRDLMDTTGLKLFPTICKCPPDNSEGNIGASFYVELCR